MCRMRRVRMAAWSVTPYLLDLSNSAPGAAKNANSCATYGGYFAGTAPINDRVMVDYRAEFCLQDQYADNPQRYSRRLLQL